MIVTDETLSAFLDAELSDTEMQQIHQQVQQQPELAMRLANLSSMDACFRKMSKRLDGQPMPAAVMELLRTARPNTQPKSGWWQQSYQSLQRHAAAIAPIALVTGLLIGYYAPADNDDWSIIAKTLEQSVSGQRYAPSTELSLTPTLAFINAEQQLCRHYRQSAATGDSEHLACKKDDHWQLIASVYLPATHYSGDYQLASHSSALDAVMDQLGIQSILTLQQEQDLHSSN